jgi:hypothetical protein
VLQIKGISLYLKIDEAKGHCVRTGVPEGRCPSMDLKLYVSEVAEKYRPGVVGIKPRIRWCYPEIRVI